MSVLHSPVTTSRVAFAPAQISDFFGSYPDLSDPLFNTYISRKQEFAENKPLTNEVLEKPRGGAYKHQKFGVRYMTWYDRALFIHDPGSGKSCLLTHSAELFKNEFLKNPDDPTKINRAIILVRGPTLTETIRNEIVCKCTDRVYETGEVLRSDSEPVMRGNITRALKTWYDIMTYRDFARIINQFEREEDLENYMSNKVIYIDEAHNVPTISDITGEQPSAETIEEVEEDEEKESYYATVWRALHKGKRNKVFLFTATPMNNLAIDIIPLLNLILPLDDQDSPGQMPRWRKDQDEDFANQPLEYFEPYLRGRVSYIRALDTGAKPNPMGARVDGYNTIIYACDMSEFQYSLYKRYSIQGANERQERFWDRSRQISNFVFPDGTFGTIGFDHHIELIKDKYQFKTTPEGQFCKQTVRTDEGLAQLSTKYAKIVEICKEKWPGDTEVVVNDEKGIIFVYFADYVKGSGAILLGLCLQAHGYDEFKYQKAVFDNNQEGSSGRAFGPCTSSSDAHVTRKERISKRPRYAILSSKTPKSQIKPILDTLNSYENRYGQYIQILIGSRTAREGININNAVAMMMASSSWNASSNWQAEERVFRSTSHVARLAERRERTGNPNATINVETYNMAAIFPGYPESLNPELRENDSSTIDPRLYVMAEEKDRLIRKIMRYLKQSSIDGYINYERNVRPTDVDGSPVCDYTTCNYQVTGIVPEYLTTVDRTTKVLYYSDDEIEHASVAVRELFSRFHSLKIEQIHQLLNTLDPIFIDMAIEKMITENARVLDRMGFFGYLRESQTGVIYLGKDPFEIRAHPENTVYNSVLIGTQDPHNNSFHDYITGLDSVTEGPMIDALINTDPNDPDFLSTLESLSLVSKVTLLEHALYEQRRTGETDDHGFYTTIISSFNHTIFEVPEPIDALQQTANWLANRGKSRGRKPNPNNQPKLKQLKLAEDFKMPAFDPNIVSGHVILHTLLNQGSHDRTSYGATSRFLKAEGQLRILKMSEGTGWRDVNQYEDLVYNTFIQKTIDQIRSHYEQRYPIYGIVLPPSNKLHIRDRESENPEAASRDARSINDGRICTTWLKPGLVDILYRLGLSLQTNRPPPNVPRQIMVDYLRSKGRELENYSLENFPDDKLIHFYQWYQSNFSRDDICDFIRQYFERTGRLFTGKLPSQLPTPTVEVGTIQTGAPQVYPDYNQPGVLIQDIPSNILPQFTQTNIQPSIYPVFQGVPQTTTSFTQPPLIPSTLLNIYPSYNTGIVTNIGLPAPTGIMTSLSQGISGLQYQ